MSRIPPRPPMTPAKSVVVGGAQNAFRPPAEVIAPDRLRTAKEAADAERARLHELGKHEGLRISQRYRDVALLAIGFIVGGVAASALMMSIYDRGAYTSAAIVDRVLGRVREPEMPAPLNVRSPDEEYRANAAAAREGCTAAELRAGRRNCAPTSRARPPADAP